jgi:hypothetical protein
MSVPAELVLAAVDKGVVTIRQAAHFADLKGPSRDSVELLIGLARAARNNSPLRADLLVSAVAGSKAIDDEVTRSQVLAAGPPSWAGATRRGARRR